MPTIKPVVSARDWRAFINLPWSLYREQPAWVPPLKIAVRDVLNTKKNPFYRHAQLHPLLAIEDGSVIGRVVGVIDEVHNQYHKERTGFFGFFESINDQDVANTLLNTVSDWARAAGMDRLRGPVSPSTNHECGLLIEGFDKPPRIMMPYNPPYYADLIEGAGFTKAMDLLAWDADTNVLYSNRFLKIAERQRQRAHITIREISLKDFDAEIDMVLEIYNQVWARNWGFVPMDEVEFRHMAKEMKTVLEPRLCLIAYVKGEPAAFGLALPNINQALIKNRSGRLLPFGLLKLWWYAFGPGRKNTINETRLLTFGIKEKFQALGMGALFYREYLQRTLSCGMPVSEASWILETNDDMNRSLESMNARVTRRYRVFEKPL